MRESDWNLLCGGSFEEFRVWRNGDFDFCFEQMMFVLLPHIALAITSAYHFGRHQHCRLRGPIAYSVVLHVRLVIVFLLVISPLILLLLLYLYEHVSLGLVQIITLALQSVSWLIYFGFVWRLHRLHRLPLRGPVEVVISVVLVFLASVVLLRTAVRHRLKYSHILTMSEEVFVYVTTGLYLCCLLTKLPSRRQHIASGVFSVQDSFSSEYRGDSETSLVLVSDGDQARAITVDAHGFFSKLFFFWVQPLLRKGSEGLLNSIDNVPPLPRCLETSYVEERFQANVYRDRSTRLPCCISRNEQQICGEENEDPLSNVDRSLHGRCTSQSPSLLSSLNRTFGLEYYSLGLLKFFSDFLSFIGPVLLNLLVTFMENSSEPTWHGYAYAGLLLVSTFLGSLSSTHFSYRINVVGLKIRAALITTIYRKTLAVSSVALSEFSLGEVVNFMSVDTDRMVDFCPSFHQLWSLPVQVGVALYLLYNQVGMAFLAGLAFAILLVPLNRWIAVKIGQLSTRMMLQKDSRVKVINEILFGIRVVKFCAWEPHFASKVGDLREAELDSLKKRKYLDAMCVYFWATTPVLISIITFATYVLLGNKLTAAKVFTSIALFGILITPLNAFPWVINGMMEAWVSLKRVQKFISLPDLSWTDYYMTNKDTMDPETAVWLRNGYFSWKRSNPDATSDTLNSGMTESDVTSLPDSFGPSCSGGMATNHLSHDLPSDGSSDVDRLLPVDQSHISCSNLESSQNHSDVPRTLCLEDISVSIKKGSLVGIVGRVGSGKSSLFSAIIGEMHKDAGDVFVDDLSDGFGLTLQESWIQQLTVRENILFGKKFELEKYKKVIEACALAEDLKVLPGGDQTEVGESGMTLSGGQKARIALARAVYQGKTLYLLDDPLAAVDMHVAEHLFEHCIMGLLKNATRLLATHHTRFLHQADLVLVIEHGKVIKSGPPSLLVDELDSSMKTAVTNDGPEEEEGQKADSVTRLQSSELQEEGGLVQEEEKDSGVVKLYVYKSYWKAVGQCLGLSVLISLFLMQASRNVSDWWLSYWVSHDHSASKNNTNSSFNLLVSSLTDCRYQTSILMTGSLDWMKTNNTDAGDNIAFYMTVYGSLAGANSVFTLARAFLFAYSGIAAAKTVHKQLFSSIMKAPISFFDMTPVGRIINRFSSDVYAVDDTLPFVLNIFLAQTFGVLGTIVICCYGLPYISILIAFLAVIYYFIQKYYRTTSRELKRITSITLSPIYAHFSETVAGLTTIRALRHIDRFQDENRKRLESNQRAQYSSKAISQWLNIWLQMIGVVMVTGVALVAVVERGYGRVSPGAVGLAISYVLSVTNLLSGLILFFTETEKQMVSVERTSQYINDIPHEDFSSIHCVPPTWPSDAVISFKDVYLQYRPGLPNALDGITFDLRPKEKLGIVGRTGSGKSSLFLALFRLVEIKSGQILIDGLDIHSLPLHELRSRLAIIPQDPFLFSGSVRENLDPKACFTDNHLLSMLGRCHLLEAVLSLGGLDVQVGERGRHFSVGQRQLMCLARALLTKAQVLCIDEATANIDLTTDRLIQQTIREEFCDKTVLTIAHRLDTVMNSDRILVLKCGKVVEFLAPSYLLENPESSFYNFVNGN